MDYERCDLRKVIMSVSSIFKMKANIRRIGWICELDEAIPAEFNTDPRRLKQILINLIGNSMKFTFRGYVKITARLVHVQEKDGVKVSIIDTGVGISKDDQANLFQLFSMVEGTRKINKGGTGIGLYQSNKFAKKLGFKDQQGIEIESVPDKGSTFSFIIENKEIATKENV